MKIDVDLIPEKHALQMAKPALSVKLTTNSPESVLRQAPGNKNNHEELANGKPKAGVEATEHLLAAPSRTPS